jgi:hypothetical protein
LRYLPSSVLLDGLVQYPLEGSALLQVLYAGDGEVSAVAQPKLPSLGLAYIPGVGLLADPTPEHYRAAIRYLTTRFRIHQHKIRPGSLADQFSTTLRRIRWSQGRMWRV